MTQFVTWCGFLGAWLLVAGPVYQASLELADEDLERDKMVAATKRAGPQPDPISSWWWLIPPARWWLERQRQKAFRERVLNAFAPDELEALLDYGSKAMAWLFVGAGGSLIAVKETWELVEHYEWPTWSFWLIAVALLLVSLMNTVIRNRRTHDMIERNAAAAAARATTEARSTTS